jgi:hypothetical protein
VHGVEIPTAPVLQAAMRSLRIRPPACVTAKRRPPPLALMVANVRVARSLRDGGMSPLFLAPAGPYAVAMSATHQRSQPGLISSRKWILGLAACLILAVSVVLVIVLTRKTIKPAPGVAALPIAPHAHYGNSRITRAFGRRRRPVLLVTLGNNIR